MRLPGTRAWYKYEAQRTARLNTELADKLLMLRKQVVQDMRLIRMQSGTIARLKEENAKLRRRSSG